KPKFGPFLNSGAGNESRTRDLNLGKVALYQLSYSRVFLAIQLSYTLYCAFFSLSNQLSLQSGFQAFRGFPWGAVADAQSSKRQNYKTRFQGMSNQSCTVCLRLPMPPLFSCLPCLSASPTRICKPITPWA